MMAVLCDILCEIILRNEGFNFSKTMFRTSKKRKYDGESIKVEITKK